MQAEKVKMKASTVSVQRSIPNSEQSDEQDTVSVHRFEGEIAKVSVDYALTINLGNYESARIGVSVEIPCYKEEIDLAHSFAQSWAEQKISKERDMIAAAKSGAVNPL